MVFDGFSIFLYFLVGDDCWSILYPKMSEKVLPKPSKIRLQIDNIFRDEKSNENGAPKGYGPHWRGVKGWVVGGPILARNKVSHESTERTEG